MTSRTAKNPSKSVKAKVHATQDDTNLLEKRSEELIYMHRNKLEH